MTIAELRRTRMAKGLSLTEISRRTRIGMSYLKSIEEGDYRSLPPGFYTRAFVRAYAEAIGVDADVVLGTLADELPSPQSSGAPHPPPAGHAPAGVASTNDLIPDARMQVLRQILDRHHALVHDDGGRVATVRTALGRPARKLLAATLDGGLLASLYLAVVGITAMACGVNIPQLMQAAGPQLFIVLSLITLLYVLLMGGIAGSTIGAMILDVSLLERSTAPLKLSAIARRSMYCVRADVAAAAEMVSLLEQLVKSRRAA